MKRWAALAGAIGLVIVAVGGGCGWATLSTARRIFNFQFSIFNRDYKTFKWCTNGLPFIDRMENMLGGKYVILLQNNMELRPPGGFAGSYAVVDTDKTGISRIKIQDIYEPDGKLPGHVDPPYPIQEAFGQGWWKLRDAGWDPDFATAAATYKWFFERGGEENIRGIVAVNLDFVDKLIGIFGPIKLATYPETVTERNFYSLAQTYAETRRTGNMTDKRGFLGAVGVTLEERIKASKIIDLIKLSTLIIRELKKGEILAWMEDAQVQREIEFRKWGGRLTDNWDQSSDYLYLVEANLGANKANCCIDRHVTVSVSGNKSDIELTWINKNEFENPKPPVFWGGNYIDYVRVVVPKDNEILDIKISGKSLRRATDKDFNGPNALRQGRSEDIYNIEQRGGLQMVGFWAVAEAGKDLSVVIETERSERPDKLLLKHQPGSGVTDYQVLVDGMIKAMGKLDRDVNIPLWTK